MGVMQGLWFYPACSCFLLCRFKMAKMAWSIVLSGRRYSPVAYAELSERGSCSSAECCAQGGANRYVRKPPTQAVI